VRKTDDSMEAAFTDFRNLTESFSVLQEGVILLILKLIFFFNHFSHIFSIYFIYSYEAHFSSDSIRCSSTKVICQRLKMKALKAYYLSKDERFFVYCFSYV